MIGAVGTLAGAPAVDYTRLTQFLPGRIYCHDCGVDATGLRIEFYAFDERGTGIAMRRLCPDCALTRIRRIVPR